MNSALSVACTWNLAACCPASATSSLAEARVCMPMARIDTLGVAGSKMGRDMMFLLGTRQCAR